MSTPAGVSIEEYLHTSYEKPDREYRDGEIIERSMPDYLHGKTQSRLVALFLALTSKFPLFPSVETRVKLRTGLYRIPDVTVFYPQEPSGVPETPPLVAIEVLSVDDRPGDVQTKLSEYRHWGVPHVWLVDPHARKFFVFGSELTEVAMFAVPELGVEVKPENIFQ